MARTAREVMTGGTDCIGEHETVQEAARRMKDLSVGALPICGEDNRLKGMVTDRDIVVGVVAEGKDPSSTQANELGTHEVVTIGADDPVEEALATMTSHKVRRLPVIDGHDLIGMVSQGDLAQGLEQPDAGELVRAISTD